VKGNNDILGGLFWLSLTCMLLTV